MSQENLELLTRAYDAWNRRDFDSIMSLVDPGIVLVQDPAIPGAETVEGRDELQRWLQGFSEMWQEFRLTPETTETAGNEIAAVVRVEAVGRGSGIALDARVGHLMKVRDGKVVGWRTFNDADAALATLRAGA